jgi:hypothetical protein
MSLYNYSFRILSVAFLLFALSSCKQGPLCDCFMGTGNEVREDRDVKTFTQIDLENKIDLVITQDTVERLYVTGGKNLIDQIETSVSGGCLYIRDHSSCNFVRGYKSHMTVFVSVHHLNSLLYNGAGTVTGKNALTDSLFAIESRDGSGFVNLSLAVKTIKAYLHTGPATITLSGSAPLMYLYSGGNGEIHAEGIGCPQIYLTQHGTGDMYINVLPASTTSLLDEEITSTGNVYCKGHPGVLEQKQTGEGKLIFQ